METPPSMSSDADQLLREFAFAHDVAHGFSSLVHNMADMFALLDKEFVAINTEDWGEAREIFEIIARELEAQRHEVLNFLEYKWPALASGVQRPLVKTESPTTLLTRMLRHYSSRAEEFDIRLEYDQRASVPIPPLWLEVHGTQRALHNILTNAIKYSYKGVERTHRFIRIRSHVHDPQRGSWALSVQNYGIGILDSEYSDIVRPGVRGKLAIADNTVGAGLGLAQVHRCMQAHGGEVRIKSKILHDTTYLTTVMLVWPQHTTARRSFHHGCIMDG